MSDLLPPCGERTVFWPDDECIEVGPCVKPVDHDGNHGDEDGVEWSTDD